VLSFELQQQQLQQQQQHGSAAATNDKEFLLDSFVIFIAVIFKNFRAAFKVASPSSLV